MTNPNDDVRLAQHAVALRALCVHVHSMNKKWWRDPVTGEPIERNRGELLMLVVSELAEAMEGDRKGLQDDKLPAYKMFDVEIVDAIIRLADIAGGLIENVDKVFFDKMQFNAQRADHKPENRLLPGGKKY